MQRGWRVGQEATFAEGFKSSSLGWAGLGCLCTCAMPLHNLDRPLSNGHKDICFL